MARDSKTTAGSQDKVGSSRSALDGAAAAAVTAVKAAKAATACKAESPSGAKAIVAFEGLPRLLLLLCCCGGLLLLLLLWRLQRILLLLRGWWWWRGSRYSAEIAFEIFVLLTAQGGAPPPANLWRVMGRGAGRCQGRPLRRRPPGRARRVEHARRTSGETGSEHALGRSASASVKARARARALLRLAERARCFLAERRSRNTLVRA